MKLPARIALLSIFLAGACLAQDRDSGIPPLPDNAALQYWFAFYSMSDESEAPPAKFVYQELVGGQVPASEALKPAILAICEKNATAVTLYLRAAAKMTRCDFGLDYSRGLALTLPHLTKMRTLARNAVAYGKLMEAQGRPREAAQVYGDAAKMGPFLAQEKILVSALVGIACEGLSSQATRSLLAHDPPAEVCEYVLARLNDLPDPLVPMASLFALESRMCKPWVHAAVFREPLASMTDEESKAIKEGKVLNQIESNEAAKESWRDLNNPEKMKKLFDPLYKEYEDKVQMAVEIMAQPYPTAVVTLREMEKDLKDTPNPFIATLTPAIPRVLTQGARAQTDLCATRILAAAALHKAKTGKYPAALSDLAPYFPKGVPRDPMSDKDFAYQLEDGRPCVRSAGPPPGTKEDQRGDQYVFGLAQILQKETTGKKWEAK